MARPSFFDGLSADDIAQIRSSLPRRSFPADSVVIAEGDTPREMYIVESGSADVFIANREGVQHRINRVSTGGTLGEMSLFTGHAASATVRTTSPLEALVVTEAEFERLVTAHPRVYRNIGAIVSERLTRADRRSLKGHTGSITLLRDAGGPPELGYALACSVAWHTRAPTVLLVADGGGVGEVAAVGASGEARADLVIPEDGSDLATTLDELCDRYAQVLVRTAELPVPFEPVRIFDLRGAEGGAGSLRRNGQGEVRVPALREADRQALRSGLLPPATEAGAALGWVARDLAGLKVGLALGAGSMKGYAHVGVLEALERLGVPIDFVAGTSVGAAVAAMVALGKTPTEIGEVLDEVGASLVRIALPRKGLLSSGAVRTTIRSVAGETRIEDLPLPLAVVAADIVTRREVVFRRGLLWHAVLASVSIPGVYPAVKIGDHTLVDGGVLNPVPTSAVADMGADVVIAVKLGEGPTTMIGEVADVAAAGRLPSVLEAITRSIEVMESKMSTDTAAAATILIAPDLQDVPGQRLRRFREGRRYIATGREAAEAALPRLGTALPWLAA